MTAPRLRLLVASMGLSLLAGCAVWQPERIVSEINQTTQAFAGTSLTRAADPDLHRTARATAVERLLAQPLGREQAIAFALQHGHAVQSLLARQEAMLAASERSARPPNPVLILERMRSPSEVELTRALSVGLFDLLFWPERRAVADAQWRLHVAELADAIVQEVTDVRHAWIEAVAAAEALNYARQVDSAADASAELARRMRAVGNFNALAQLRQQAFHAEAVTRLAVAEHRLVAAREALARKLGLAGDELGRLRLPERLPELPRVPMDDETAEQRARRERLDLRLALAQLEAESRRVGIERVLSWTDIELDLRSTTMSERADGHRTRVRGGEIALGLPLFDSGDTRRAAQSARWRAAAFHYENVRTGAASHLRERYSGYRSAWDLARHAREEIVPLRRRISDEMLLRYNGMLIDVFALLADAREQALAVSGSIEALAQFWKAEASLEAAFLSQPRGSFLLAGGAITGGEGNGDH